jgi:hypothetical protein
MVVGFKVRGLGLRCLKPLSAGKKTNIQSDNFKSSGSCCGRDCMVVVFTIRGLGLRCLVLLSAEKNNNIQSDSF